jgi:hypothetical protein
MHRSLKRSLPVVFQLKYRKNFQSLTCIPHTTTIVLDLITLVTSGEEHKLRGIDDLYEDLSFCIFLQSTLTSALADQNIVVSRMQSAPSLCEQVVWDVETVHITVCIPC